MSLTRWMRTTHRTRRTFLRDAGAASTVLLTAACGGSSEVVQTVMVTPGQASAVTVPSGTTSAAAATASQATAASSTSAAPTARLIASPKFGSVDVAPTAAVTVTAFSAKITELSVTAADGAVLAGAIDAAGTTWTLTDRMTYGQTYTFAGTATDNAGNVTPISGTLATVSPASTVAATFVQDEGGVFGVGQPIVVVFSGQVTNKAEAQKRLVVTTDKGEIVGSWGWLQDEDIQADGVLRSQVHWRPKEFWPADTKVTVQANLYGIDYGNGNWGREDLTRSFKIGRKLVAIADVNSFRLKVYVSDQLERDYPVSYGKTTDTRRQTRSGTHLVQGKYPEYDMCNTQFNYCGVKVTWAVRINNNGEFIHENDSTIPYQGVANVSHGCVNMSTANAKDFYNLCILGDVVEVSGTDVQLSAADYIYDWAYSYDTWKSFSAV